MLDDMFGGVAAWTSTLLGRFTDSIALIRSAGVKLAARADGELSKERAGKSPKKIVKKCLRAFLVIKVFINPLQRLRVSFLTKFPLW